MDQITLQVPTSFPELLKFSMKINSSSLPKIAKKAGVSYPTIRKIVTGDETRFSNMEKVAKAAGIAINFTLAD